MKKYNRSKTGFYGKKHSSYTKWLMSEGHKIAHANKRETHMDKKELSKEEKEEIVAETMVAIVGIMKLHDVPEKFMMAMFDAYQAGAANSLARLMNKEKEQEDEELPF